MLLQYPGFNHWLLLRFFVEAQLYHSHHEGNHQANLLANVGIKSCESSTFFVVSQLLEDAAKRL